MATRFYVTTRIPTREQFAYSTDWEFNTEDVERRQRMFPWRSSFSQVFDGGFEDSAVTVDGLVMQFVSPALAAQTITGTVAGVFLARENNSAANMQSQFIARVIAPDGTVRGTLVPASTAALSNEWLVSTTSSSWRNARFPVGSNGTSVTSVAALDGDKIVIEVGFRAINTNATTFSGFLSYGGGTTNSDLAQNDTSTQSAGYHFAWMEFSQNLTFLETPTALSDSIAGAPEVMPDPLEEVLVRTTAFNTFTNETDDPDEFEDWSGTVNPPSGWIKLTATDTDAYLLLYWMAGFGIYPTIFIYDEVPTASSTPVDLYTLYFQDNPADYDDQVAIFAIPEGETWYVAAVPGFDASSGTWFDTDFEFLVRRLDAGIATGDIKDDIADAVDCFPAAVSTEQDSETTNLTTFTAEADDPDEVATFHGNPEGYTGWMRLEVPEEALVTISVIQPTDVGDLVFFLYDEVPTSSSVAIHSSDDDDPVNFSWPYLPEVLLAAGTYYLLIAPYNGAEWDPFGDTFEDDNPTEYGLGRLTVRVRWEAAPVIEGFSLDATISGTWLYPMEPQLPTLVGSETVTVDSNSDLTIPIPAGTEENDLLIIAISWDRQADTGISTNLTFLDDPLLIGELIALLSGSAGTDHRLHLYSMRYHEGLSSFSVRTTKSAVPHATAKAGAITTWRNARSATLMTSVQGSSYFTGPHLNTGYTVSGLNAEYGQTALYMAIWAGGGTGEGRWDFDSGGPTPSELYDDTATDSANIAAWTWAEEQVQIDQKSVIPATSATTLCAVSSTSPGWCGFTATKCGSSLKQSSPGASSSTPSFKQPPTRHTPVPAHIRGHIWTRPS